VPYGAFSSDGTKFLTGSWDKSAKIWGSLPDNPTPLIQTLGTQASIRSLAFTQDGNFAATASRDKLVQYWDAITGENLMTLPKQEVIALAFSPDGTQLLTASEDKIARLWALPTGKLVQW
jgi:WD40 repeat protein